MRNTLNRDFRERASVLPVAAISTVNNLLHQPVLTVPVGKKKKERYFL